MPSKDTRALFEASMKNLAKTQRVSKIGVAVSGGSDSMAMLSLAIEWGAKSGVTILAATVNHGLRKEAEDEANAVKAFCQKHGVDHVTLRWENWNGAGNVQSEARNARKRLLRSWADAQSLDTVLIGHTANDQAETFLMRLSRGSGVDGLASIPKATDDGYFFRPLLEAKREELRTYLKGIGMFWIDDPSNDNPKYDRVKARRMMSLLEGLGLTVDRLTETANHMRKASVSLNEALADRISNYVDMRGPEIIVSREVFDIERGDFESRLLSDLILHMGGGIYRPRLEALRRAADGILDGETRALNGVMLLQRPDGRVSLVREPARVEPEVDMTTDLWDGRWRLTAEPGVSLEGLIIRALGEDGLRQCKGWKATGFSAQALISSPSIWSGDDLVFAPFAGKAGPFNVEEMPLHGLSSPAPRSHERAAEPSF